MAGAAPRKLFSAELAMLKRRGQDTSSATTQVEAADSSAVLDAIAELKAVIGAEIKDAVKTLKPPPPDDLPELNTLRGQLKVLSECIEDTKQQIASIHPPGVSEDRLSSAASELDAIISSTESATHKILNATEEIDELISQIRDRVGDDKAVEMLDQISNLGITILEACNFQDINGQRTTKVIKTISFLEEKIIRMIDIWGADQFESIEHEEEKKEGDAALLHGPQLEGQGISQDDIDALFD
jgi:chemotaxis protein CheZ